VWVHGCEGQNDFEGNSFHIYTMYGKEFQLVYSMLFAEATHVRSHGQFLSGAVDILFAQ